MGSEEEKELRSEGEMQRLREFYKQIKTEVWEIER